MSSVSVIGSILYYLLLPVTTLYSLVLTILAPVLHLFSHALYVLVLPVTVLAKFETLYIYLGVAAVVGLVTGSILHVSSSVLVSLLNLESKPEPSGRTAASIRAAREQSKLQNVWESSARSNQGRIGTGSGLEKEYAEWLEKDSGKYKDDQGVLRQTILEEVDDSEDGF